MSEREQQIRERYTPAVLDDIERHPHNVGAKEVRELVALLRALTAVTEERNEWVTRAGHLASESAEAARELAVARRELEVSDRERDALLDDIEDYRRRLKATSDDYNEKANALAAAREETGRLREALLRISAGEDMRSWAKAVADDALAALAREDGG